MEDTIKYLLDKYGSVAGYLHEVLPNPHLLLQLVGGNHAMCKPDGLWP